MEGDLVTNRPQGFMGTDFRNKLAFHSVLVPILQSLLLELLLLFLLWSKFLHVFFCCKGICLEDGEAYAVIRLHVSTANSTNL